MIIPPPGPPTADVADGPDLLAAYGPRLPAIRDAFLCVMADTLRQLEHMLSHGAHEDIPVFALRLVGPLGMMGATRAVAVAQLVADGSEHESALNARALREALARTVRAVEDLAVLKPCD